MERSWKNVLVLLVIGLLIEFTTQQNMRVAPGVPPQHYDPNLAHQPPPPNYQQPPQYQQQQQHHQQIPQQQIHQQQQQQVNLGHGQAVPLQQQQQVPIQHHQQPPPPQVVPQQQQQPGGHGHAPHHAHHGGSQPLLDASNVANERKHIQEHMDVPIDTSQMSEQELQFHYFKMHDADSNDKLDGCELVKSLIHWHDHEGEGESVALQDNQIESVVDSVFDYDGDGDGMIDYREFMTAQNLQKREEKKKCKTCRD